MLLYLSEKARCECFSVYPGYHRLVNKTPKPGAERGDVKGTPDFRTCSRRSSCSSAEQGLKRHVSRRRSRTECRRAPGAGADKRAVITAGHLCSRSPSGGHLRLGAAQRRNVCRPCPGLTSGRGERGRGHRRAPAPQRCGGWERAAGGGGRGRAAKGAGLLAAVTLTHTAPGRREKGPAPAEGYSAPYIAARRRLTPPALLAPRQGGGSSRRRSWSRSSCSRRRARRRAMVRSTAAGSGGSARGAAV